MKLLLSFTQHFKEDLHLRQIASKSIIYLSELLHVSTIHMFSYSGSLLESNELRSFDSFFELHRDAIQAFFKHYDKEFDLEKVKLEMEFDSTFQLMYQNLFQQLELMEIELIFPIKMNGSNLIFLIFTKKDNGRSYTLDEKALLISICTFLSAVFQNAIYYQKLMFNKDLMDLINDFSISLNELGSREQLFERWSHYFKRLFGGSIDLIYDYSQSLNQWVSPYHSGVFQSENQAIETCPLMFDSSARLNSKYQFYRPDLEGIDHDKIQTIFKLHQKETCLLFYLSDDHGCYMVLFCFFSKPTHSFPVSQHLIVDMYLQLLHVSLQNTDQYLNLKEAQLYNESILEQLTTPVILLNSDHIMTGFNKASEKMLQTSMWSLLGKPVSLLIEMFEEFSKVIDSLSVKQRRNIELELMSEGSLSVYSVSTVALSNQYGGYVFVFTDVSDQRSLEAQVSHASRLSALGTLAAGVAHEIKNPLVAIRTFTQLLPKKYKTDGFKERYMSIVPPQIDRISELCHSLVQLGTPKIPQKSEVLFSDILEKVFILGKLHAPETKKLFTIECPEAFTVFVDRDQFEQVMLNLILNAVESLEDQSKGRIKLTGMNLNETSFQIKISDNGCGIEPDRVTLLFDPFFTTKITGTGLGMSIVHQIVTVHGGEIKVSSKVGFGTTFTIVLPRI